METNESLRVHNLAILVEHLHLGVVDAYRIQLIARALHRLDEAECNGELTSRQEARQRNLEQEARDTLARMGLHVYRQGDPRGWPIYIGRDEMTARDYSRNTGVYPR